MNPSQDHSDSESITWISSHEEKYKDRKMVKWLGFILSDHMDCIKAEQKEQKETGFRKEKQSLEKISQILQVSYTSKKIVNIQVDFIYNGQYQDDIQGRVVGFDGPYIHIRSWEDFFSLPLELIHHISLLEEDSSYS